MKRLYFVCTAVLLTLFFAGCGPSAGEGDPGSLPAVEPSAPAQQSPAEDDQLHILIAYFSATGNTKRLAEYVSQALNADLFEIAPEIPYTGDDLNYSDDRSRTSLEMNDDASRPAISSRVENMDSYDIVFLAYPIWWGQAPRIISTFLESYDFDGKTVIPFCTSGSSGIGSSAENLHALCSGHVTWFSGERFSSATSREQIFEWVKSLEIQ